MMLNFIFSKNFLILFAFLLLTNEALLAENTDMDYDSYLKDKILTPLGMTASSFTQPPSTNTELATGYWHSGKALDCKYHIYPEMAAAGLWTNPTELAKYIIEIQRTLCGQSNQFISKETAERMVTPHLETEITGLGVFIDIINEKKYFSHGGSNEGFKCYYYGSLEGGNGMVIMLNSENIDILPEITRSIITAYEW